MVEVEKAPVVHYEGFTVAWDVATEAPAIWEQLARENDWMRPLHEELRARVPTAMLIDPFDDGTYFKPPMHTRALYRRCGEGRGFLALKGSEIRARDLDSHMARTRHKRIPPSNFLLNERFVIIEHAVPYGLLLQSEALDEARVAAEFQTAYLERFGKLADVPMPIMVLRWPNAVVDEFIERAVPHLSTRAAALCRSYIQEGLGCYVYYHPSDPSNRMLFTIRAEVDSRSKNVQNYAARREALDKVFDVDGAMNRYLTLVTEALALGYFPVSVPFQENGAAIEPHNVLVNGGLVDLGSFQRMVDVRDTTEFHQTWLLTLASIRRTLRQFFASTFQPAWSVWRDDDPLQGMIAGYLWTDLVRRLDQLARTVPLDGRLAKLIHPLSMVAGIEALLDGTYREPEHGFFYVRIT